LLEWTVKQGGQVNVLVLQQMIRSRREIPDDFSGPDLNLGLQLYWTAFWDLSSCRNTGGMIPWTAVQTWAETYKLDEEVADDLHYLIREMDQAFIKLVKVKASLNDQGRGKPIGRETVPVSRQHPVKR